MSTDKKNVEIEESVKNEMAYSRSKNNTYRMLRNQLTSLFLYEKIETGSAKAAELKKEAERLLAIARSEDKLGTIKKLNNVLYANSAKKLFDERDTIESVSIFRSGVKLGDGSEKAIVMINKKLPAKK